MNCTQVEKLLALYVEADLGEASARQVSEHLQSCDACRQSADEFVASQSFLRLHAPPEFDAAFFDAVRRNVLRQIQEPPARPAFISSFSQLFARRSFAYVASLVLLLASGALIALQLAHRNTGRTPHDAAQDTAHNAAHIRPHDATPEPAAATTTPRTHNGERVYSSLLSSSPEVAEHKRTQRARVPDLKSSGAQRRPAPPFAASGAAQEQASNISNRSPMETNTSPGPALEQAQPALVNASIPDTIAFVERKTTRIELQTGDPNVRIIWLSPQTAQTLSTKK